MWKQPWIITQEWHDVLFLHWPVTPEEVRKYIPSNLELDLYNNYAWVSLVYFQVKGNRPRLIPSIPGMSSFLQLNVRTYVTYKERTGVYFFSLDANNSFIVSLTTLGKFLPYRHANISFSRSENMYSIHSKTIDKTILSETLNSSFEPNPEVIESNHFDRWLIERYHLWTKVKGYLLRIDIKHSPWILQSLTCTIFENTMAPFIRSDYKVNHPIAHYSKMKKARMYLPVIEKQNNK